MAFGGKTMLVVRQNHSLSDNTTVRLSVTRIAVSHTFSCTWAMSMGGIDSIARVGSGQSLLAADRQKGLANARRSNRLRRPHGRGAPARLRALCPPVPRPSPRPRILLLRPVPLASPLLNSPAAKASATSRPACARFPQSSTTPASGDVSHGARSPTRTSARLADLRRLRPDVHSYRPTCTPRTVRRRAGETAYVLDATTIDLCLALFPWAAFQRHEAAVKLHTVLDLRVLFPRSSRSRREDGRRRRCLDPLVVEPGAFYIMDRGYTNFERLYRLTQGLAFFIIRGNAGTHLRAARLTAREQDHWVAQRSHHRPLRHQDGHPFPRRAATHCLRRTREPPSDLSS